LWSRIASFFKKHPERLKVVKALVENGLRINYDGKIYCNEIEIPAAKIADFAEVDRRTVYEAIKAIQENEELKTIFANIRSAGLSLKELAKHLGFGVVEITPIDPKAVGVLAGAASILAEEGIGIRQALADDPELTPQPKLTLITEKKIPGNLIPKLLNVKGVEKLSIY
jgi:predicted regulator of amino acid metabolism with ACT domain